MVLNLRIFLSMTSALCLVLLQVMANTSLMSARKAALDEMSQRASKMGANAIIGVSFQYSTVGAQNGMLMITCNGTAVVV